MARAKIGSMKARTHEEQVAWVAMKKAVRIIGQAEVANRLGVHQTTVSGWVRPRKKTTPSPLVWRSIRQVFGEVAW